MKINFECLMLNVGFMTRVKRAPQFNIRHSKFNIGVAW